MAVFRNVMAFLGLDEDDEIYDDETYFEEDEEVNAAPAPDRKRKTIAIDERLPSISEAPSFGFSADSEMNEMGGVGAVRPLRPVPTPEPEVPEALIGNDERRIHQPDTSGAFGSGASAANSQVVAGSPHYEQPRSEQDQYQQAEYSQPQHEHAHYGQDPGGDGRQDGAHDPSMSGGTDQQFRGAQAADGDQSPNHGAATDSSRPSLTAIDGPSAMTYPSPAEEPQSTVVTHAKPRLHIPSSFDDASKVADDFRVGAPVVMNLRLVDKPIARRLVDFASGVCYALSGGMERVAPNVYLLTPAGIDVSPEDRRRMQERGFDR